MDILQAVAQQNCTWITLEAVFTYCTFSKHNLQFLQQLNVKKCPSSKWCWDLNPHTTEQESSPLTPRPGQPPNDAQC